MDIKRQILLLSCIVLFCADAFSFITLRFYDNGELIYSRVTEERTNQSIMVSRFIPNDTITALKNRGKLQACDGFEFEGWKVGSPLLDEMIGDIDNPPTNPSVIISDQDINLYAVYAKTRKAYEFANATSYLNAGDRYVLCGSTDKQTFYAMSNRNVKANEGSPKASALYGVPVTRCTTDGLIYDVDPSCIWVGDGNSLTTLSLRNVANDQYFHIGASHVKQFIVKYGIDYFDQVTYEDPSTYEAEVDNSTGEWTMSKFIRVGIFVSTYGYLYYVPSTDYFGSTKQNLFVVAESSDNIGTKGKLYLFHEITQCRYISHCDEYSVNLHACGGSCSSSVVEVSPASLTQTRQVAACNGIQSFNGFGTSDATVNIKCGSRWTFAGWVENEPQAQTDVEPTFLPTSNYHPYHDNVDLYAVYRHKTNGVADYWTSYIDCDPYTVHFHPEHGTIGGNSAVHDETESPAGAGVTTPTTAYDCVGWTFGGWLDEAVLGETSAPSGMLAASATYYPKENDEHWYAVYKTTAGDYFSSYPMCEKCTLLLDACNGTVNGVNKYEMIQSTVNEALSLANADTDCPAFWNFYGWSKIKYITESSDVPITVASPYLPTQVKDTLYATYYREASDGNRLYTSITSCTPRTVMLHASTSDDVDVATVNSAATVSLTEDPLGSGIVMPEAIPACTDRWEFAGWQKGSPLDHKYVEPTGLYAAGASYTPSSEGEVFYAVYAHSNGIAFDYWTSNIDCNLYKVLLNACEGKFVNNTDTLTVGESVAGAGVVLPKPTPLCNTRGWVFYGWVEDGDLVTTSNVSGVTIHEAGSTFKPTKNNMQLFAVYMMDKYIQVSDKGHLDNTGKYVLTFHHVIEHSNITDVAIINTENALSPGRLEALDINVFVDEVGKRYVSAPSDNMIWYISSTNNATQTFRSYENDKYITSAQNNPGITTGDSGTPYTIDFNNNLIFRNGNNNYYKYLNFTHTGASEFVANFYVYHGNSTEKFYIYKYDHTYYSSYPHCTEYTVQFYGCDGQANQTEVTEDEAGKGVVVPGVNDICSGWTFAGWAEQDVESKTDVLNDDIYPEGAIYVPTKNNVSLYAVYYQPKNTYTRVNSASDIYLGHNYLFVAENGGNYYAMGNTYNDGLRSRHLNATSVAVSDATVTNSTAALNWRIQGIEREEDYRLIYNPDKSKFLDMKTQSGYVTMSDTRIDNFTITESGTNQFRIQSNVTTHGNKMLCYRNNRFEAYSSGSSLYLFRQNADFWSYPCSAPAKAMRWGQGEVIVESIALTGDPEGVSARITSVEPYENGGYKIKHTSAPGSHLRISWDDKLYSLKVPYVATEGYAPVLKNYPAQDFVITSNTSFVVDHDIRLHTVSVYDNAELVIANGFRLIVDTLILRSEGDERHPNVVFGGENSTIVVNSGVVYHDIRIDDASYHLMSNPFATHLSDLRYAGLFDPASSVMPTYYTDYYIQEYDGAQRQVDVVSGHKEDTYWKHIISASNVADAATFALTGGKGYAIGIRDATVAEGAHHKRTLRFAYHIDSDYLNDQERGNTERALPVTAGSTTDVTLQRHFGWNFIGNPYLHRFSAGEPGSESGLLNGLYEMDSSGKYALSEDDESRNVPYLSVYNPTDGDYIQMRANSIQIMPFYALFVQVEKNDMLVYRNPIVVQASAPRRMLAASQSKIAYTGLLFADTEYSSYDMAGLVISDKYSNEYEIGADLEKLMSKADKVHVYTLNNNISLAFNALNEEQAAQPIPVGVYVPADGQYIFAFDKAQYKAKDIQSLMLTDNEANTTVDLLLQDYICNLKKGTHNSRFELNAVVKQGEDDTPTSIDLVPNADGIRVLHSSNGVTLEFEDNKDLFVYDMTGRLVFSQYNAQGVVNIDLPQGIYNVYLRDQNQQAVVRTIVW